MNILDSNKKIDFKPVDILTSCSPITSSPEQNLTNLLPVAVLCTNKLTTYSQLPYVFPFDKEMNAYTFKSNSPVIAHPPCQQWSRLRSFAKENKEEKDLAIFCLEIVKKNGGVFEHPAGSSFFKYAGIENELFSVDQHWWGFPARKRTYLYFNKCGPDQLPLNFDAIKKNVSNMPQSQRSITTIDFAKWLVSSVRNVKIATW
jgi:hypothetical protein